MALLIDVLDNRLGTSSMTSPLEYLPHTKKVDAGAVRVQGMPFHEDGFVVRHVENAFPNLGWLARGRVLVLNLSGLMIAGLL